MARSFYFNNQIDTVSCQSTSIRVSNQFIFDKNKGLVEDTFNYYDGIFGGFKLIDSNIAGELKGSFDLFVGIEEENKPFQSIKIFPNPANQQLFIKNIEHLTGTSYSIINVNGKLMESGVLDKGIIKLSNYKQGIYFLKLSYGRKTSSVKFIIKNF